MCKQIICLQEGLHVALGLGGKLPWLFTLGLSWVWVYLLFLQMQDDTGFILTDGNTRVHQRQSMCLLSGGKRPMVRRCLWRVLDWERVVGFECSFMVDAGSEWFLPTTNLSNPNDWVPSRLHQIPCSLQFPSPSLTAPLPNTKFQIALVLAIGRTCQQTSWPQVLLSSTVNTSIMFGKNIPGGS